MKKILLGLLIPISLVACSVQATEVAETPSNMDNVPSVSIATPILTPTQKTANDGVEEAEVRDLVESFGKKLQTVSLLSPEAAQDMEEQYAEFVSPSLLDTWTSDVSKAPGRLVSSPWPDRIEITTLVKEGSDRYVISGFIIEVTSVEVVNGGAAAKIPIHLVVQKDQGGWVITEYAEEKSGG